VKAANDAATITEALRPGTLIYPAFVALEVGGRKLGLAAGILLSQAYWLSTNRRGEWTYTPAEWKDRTGLSDDQVTDSLRRLQDAGILERYRVGVVKVMRYRLDLKILSRLLTNSVPVTGKSGYGYPENPVTGNRKIRLRVYKEKASSKEEARGRKAPQERCIPAHAFEPMAGKREQAAAPGCPLEEWQEYAGTISAAWMQSGDSAACWDDMTAHDWRDTSRRLVRDWKAKARRYFAAWERSGGNTKAGAAAAKAAKAAKVAETVQERTARGKRFMALCKAAAEREDWESLAKVESDWMQEDPEQCDYYRREKRPRPWATGLLSLGRK